MSDVMVDDRIMFSSILSTCKDSEQDPNTSENLYFRRLGAMLVLMRVIGTLDVVLTFDLNDGAGNVTLWAHHSALAQEPDLAKLIDKLKVVESFSIMSSIAAGAMSYHVTNYSLESYYSLVHFLYTGIIDLQVNLNDFAIGSPPTKPYSLACKERLAFEGLFTSTPSPCLDASTDADTTKVRPLVPVVTLNELFQLADCYQVQDLRAHCRTWIIKSLSSSNSLKILFEFAYRNEDLRSVILKVVPKSLDKNFWRRRQRESAREVQGPPGVPHPSGQGTQTQVQGICLKSFTGLRRTHCFAYCILRYDLTSFALDPK